MEGPAQQARLIALEVRLTQIGFAVFEGPTRLLDWGVGVRWFKIKRGLKVISSRRFRELLAQNAPAIVVMRKIKHQSVRNKKRLVIVLRQIRAESRRNACASKVLRADDVRRHFASRGLDTKREVAEDGAQRFEELSLKLPKKKKAYQSEARAMLIFDAVATAIAFSAKLALQRNQTPAQGLDSFDGLSPTHRLN